MSKVESNQNTSIHSNIFGVIPYMEPQRITDKTFEYKKYSDIYSFGVLMWEISSCRRPFEEYYKENNKADECILSMNLIRGIRETPVENTPQDYEILYTRCWNKEV